MVRIKISKNTVTKDYDWKILDDANQIAFYIETPNHNELILRNFYYEPDGENAWTNRIDPNLNMFLPFVADFIMFPLILHLQIAESESGQKVYIYHPIRQTCVEARGGDGRLVVSAAIAVCIDILNFVLEFDAKQRALAMEEHRVLRQKHSDEFRDIASAALPEPRKVTDEAQ